MKAIAIHQIRRDGTRIVCPTCDPLSQVRRSLDESNVEWVSLICPRHEFEKRQTTLPLKIQETPHQYVFL